MTRDRPDETATDDCAAELREALSALHPPDAVRRPGDVAAAARLVLRRLTRESDVSTGALPFRADVEPEPQPGEWAPDAIPEARRIGRALDGMQRRMARTGQPGLGALFRAACQRLGLPPTDPVRRAGMAAAVLAEVRPAPTFHDARHTREVLANAIWLAAAEQGLPPAEHALLLLAAVAHDIGHDGGTNRRADESGTIRYRPCFLEDFALGFVMPLARRAGLAAERLRDLEAMLRQTDIARRGSLTALYDGTPVAQIGIGAAAIPDAEADWLRARPMVLRAAALLADADVLASAGFSARAQRRRQLRLARERGVPARDADGLGFLRDLLGGRFISQAARVLEPNLHRIGRALE